MTLWLASRRWRLCLLATGLLVLGLVPLGAHTVPVPSLLSGLALPVPVSVFLPLGLVAVVAVALTAGDPLTEIVARRRLPLLDAGFGLGCVLLVLAALSALSPVLGADTAVTAARDTAGYLGLVLLIIPLVGADVATSVPVGYAIVATLFGRAGGEGLAWWAWPVAPSTDRLALLQAALLLLIGEAATVARGVVTPRWRAAGWRRSHRARGR